MSINVSILLFFEIGTKPGFLAFRPEDGGKEGKDVNFGLYATMYATAHIRKESVSHVILKIIEMTMFIGITSAARQKSQKISMWKFFMCGNVKKGL
ncbi:hypothetical protein [Janthinobacterium sp.]|uniref:hypothetical protein n=1 Tax=Janthinobacterium sp. TaxID=1871054 RepID=UPI0025907426|nr:hypothetical protein [Janthinobacterium sp.]MCX7291881.1 hypothetical protein [Janthinobacterium sp.]